MVAGIRVPLEKLELSYTLKRRHHFKYFTPTEYRGLKDHLKDEFQPTYLAFNEEIPILMDDSWKFVEDPKQIAITPVHVDIEHFDFGTDFLMSIRIVSTNHKLDKNNNIAT